MTEATGTTGSGALSVRPLPRTEIFIPRGEAKFSKTGTVETGHKRGRLLGYRTINLRIAAQPARGGVWCGAVSLDDGRIFAAAVSIGRRATFQEDTNDDVLLEAHLLDFDEELYGREVTVTVYRKLRGQRRYRRVQELIDQLERDVAMVRDWATVSTAPRSTPVPGWAVARAESAIAKQIALGNGVPDSRALARLTGLSRHVARLCLSRRQQPMV